MKGGFTVIYGTIAAALVAAVLYISGVCPVYGAQAYQQGEFGVAVGTVYDAQGRVATPAFKGKAAVVLVNWNPQRLEHTELFSYLQERYHRDIGFYIVANQTLLTRRPDVFQRFSGVPVYGAEVRNGAMSSCVVVLDNTGRKRCELPDNCTTAEAEQAIRDALSVPAAADAQQRAQALVSNSIHRREYERKFLYSDAELGPSAMATTDAMFAVWKKLAMLPWDRHTDSLQTDEGKRLVREGYALYSFGLTDDALRKLCGAIVAEPKNALLHALRARLYLECGNVRLAAKDMDTALAIEPENSFFSVGASYIAVQEKKYAKAASYLEAYLRRGAPLDEYGVCSRLYIQGNEADKGLAVYKEGLRHEDNRAAGQYLYGNLCVFAGRYEEGVLAYESALREFTAYCAGDMWTKRRLRAFEANIYRGQALCLYGLRRYDAALRRVNEAIQLAGMEKKDTGLDAWELPFSSSSSSLAIYGLRALIYEALGDREGAAADWEKAYERTNSI